MFERAQPALLAHGDGDEVADLDQFRLAEMLVQPRPERVVGRQVPGDRLGVGERRLLPLVVARRALEIDQVRVIVLDLRPDLAALIERWLPQNSHFTERET